MKPNEHDIFDELVRGKLAGYSEPPDPEWIQQIHLKKNRAINLYQLYRYMLVLLIAGAGLISAYKLTVTTPDTAAHAGLDQTDMIQTHPAVNTSTSIPVPTEFALGGPRILRTNKAQQPTQSSEGNRVRSAGALPSSSAHPTFKNEEKPSLRSQLPKQQQKSPAFSSIRKPENTPITAPQKGTKNTSQPIQQPEKARSVKDTSEASAKTKQKNEAACIAKFDFYTSYTGEFQFTNLSDIPSTASIQWTFGDGNSSNHTSPTYRFSKGGTYLVTLTTFDRQSGCSNAYSKEVVVAEAPQPKRSLQLEGYVMAGARYVANASVEVYAFDANKGRFESLQTIQTNQDGSYRMPIQPGTRYLLKGYPNADAKDYLPTFWGNTIETENAVEVILMEGEQTNLSGYTIELALGEKMPTNNPEPEPIALNNPHPVFIIDGNNNIVGVGNMNANGELSFEEDIAPGDYTILDPATGKSSVATVSGRGSASSSLLNDARNTTSNQVSVFPNPANNQVNFGVQSDESELATLVIMNAAGNELVRKQVQFTSGFNQTQYDISSFSPGVYYVMILRGGKKILSSRLVKSQAATKE